jgi:aspartate-semialdehyde dehydrogenase
MKTTPQEGRKLKVAVVGATGAVGRELLSVLEARNFPVSELLLFASNRSMGKALNWKGKSHRCRTLESGCFDGIDLAFFDASDAVSRQWVPHAAEAGAFVIDNSATFRYDDDILLLVPEVNGHLLKERLNARGAPFQAGSGAQFSARERILTGPNCSTVQLVVALKPIHDTWTLKRIVVSSYQSTSGAGTAAVEELSFQTVAMMSQHEIKARIFPHQIAFNCIPHIGGFKEDGSTSEECKIQNETRKILGLPHLKISATAVRVPTFSCHAESVNIECEKQFEISEVREALSQAEGIILQDDPSKNIYPLGMASQNDTVSAATGKDAVYVGRVRKDSSLDSGLNLWIVSDNLRKGAALNAVQIAELLYKKSY